MHLAVHRSKGASWSRTREKTRPKAKAANREKTSVLPLGLTLSDPAKIKEQRGSDHRTPAATGRQQARKAGRQKATAETSTPPRRLKSAHKPPQAGGAGSSESSTATTGRQQATKRTATTQQAPHQHQHQQHRNNAPTAAKQATATKQQAESSSKPTSNPHREGMLSPTHPRTL